MREIQLTRGKVALVDDADYELVASRSWMYLASRSGAGYAVHAFREDGRSRSLMMHRLLLDAPAGVQVDHINGNGLDNRRGNLRLVSQDQNQRNRRSARDSSSRFKGVSWDRRSKIWRAFIRVEGRLRHLGQFACEEEAARVYDAAARKHFGSYSCVNFPRPGERGAAV